MQRLSATDATFLYAETDDAPMNIGLAQLVTIPADYEGRFRDNFFALLKERSAEVPMMNWVATEQPFNLDYPVWVDAGKLDWRYHFKTRKMPKGSTIHDVLRALEVIHIERLDRSKPLFQYYVFDGLADNQAVVYSKMHHCMIDGQAGAQLMMLMYDLEPTPRGPLTEEQKQAFGLNKTPCNKPTLATALIDAAFSTAEKPFYKQFGSLRRTASAALHQYQQTKHNPAAEGTLGGAPNTPFNEVITRERKFSIGSVPLGETKHIAKSLNAKVNDVMLAITGGGLRAYLDEKGMLPDKSLVCAVPIAQAQKEASLNNVAAMTVAWRTDEADPLRRIKKIHETAQIGKKNSVELFGAIDSGTGFKLPSYVAKPLAATIMRKEVLGNMPPIMNGILSNVPGAPMTLYIAGAEMQTAYPLSVISHGTAINITVFSYRDRIDLGITTCPAVVPDADHLMELILAEFEETKAALDAEHEAANAPRYDVVETAPAAATAEVDIEKAANAA